jgi:hypothetical protein
MKFDKPLLKSFKRTIFTIYLEDYRIRINITLDVNCYDTSRAYIVTHWRGIKYTINTGIVTCRNCHKRYDKTTAYKIYTSHNGTYTYGYCSKKCYIENTDVTWQNYNDRQNLKQICSIIKEHDENLKADDERIDIKKFLRMHLECGGDDKK